MITPRTLLACGALALSLVLGGCDLRSPEARCFAEATAKYRVAWREATRIRADLARGYALHPVEIAHAQAVTCRVNGDRSTCIETGRDNIALPVAIDRAALVGRLRELDATMDALRPAAMAAAAPCGYGDWSQAPPARPPPP